jgi:hypothetical protein
VISQALALLLLLWPVAAAAQSPGWEEQLAAAERAWDRGQVADAERLYVDAVKRPRSSATPTSDSPGP